MMADIQYRVRYVEVGVEWETCGVRLLSTVEIDNRGPALVARGAFNRAMTVQQLRDFASVVEVMQDAQPLGSLPPDEEIPF